jgi:hypothetical protein
MYNRVDPAVDVVSRYIGIRGDDGDESAACSGDNHDHCRGFGRSSVG